MSNPFEAIPIRSNGNQVAVDASWWNTIRTYLIDFFDGYIGGGAVVETQFTIADNQSSYQNITGLLVDGSINSCVDIEYTIYRASGGTRRRERGVLRCMYKPTDGWSFERESWGDDALNMSDSLNVTTAGQVQYKSDSFAAGKIRYKTGNVFLIET